MHELPITKSIFKTVLSKAEAAGATGVNRVVLEIGILRDFVPDFIQKYWDYIAAGTIAEGAAIEVIELDAEARCGRCGNEYKITKEHISDAHCPVCGSLGGQLIAGEELRIKGIEIRKNGTLQGPSETN